MIRTYIGKIGCGKSSYAVKLSRKWIKKGVPVYSNFPIKDCFLYDISDLGKYDVSNCVVILDEAGIDLNNRSYKETSKDFIKWVKLIRHYHVKEMYIFSQANDFDITLRRLSSKLYVIKKYFFYSKIIQLRSKLKVNDQTNEPYFAWEVPKFFGQLLSPRFLPFLYWRFFDSFSSPILPEKEFTQCSKSDIKFQKKSNAKSQRKKL